MKLKFLISLFFLQFILQVNGQFEFHYPDWYANAGFNKLIVKVGDQSESYTQKIMKLIEKNWTICPVEFYTDKIDLTNLTDGNLFLNFERYTIASQYARDYGTNGGVSRGEVSYNDYYYLNFWVIDKKYNPKRDWWDYRYTVARSEFYLKSIGMGEDEYKAFKMDSETISGIRESVFHIERDEVYPKVFDFTNLQFQTQYLNGAEGNLKNMLQYVCKQIKSKTDMDFLSPIKNESELSNLKKGVLYLPNYWYGEKGTILENLSSDDQYVKSHVSYVQDLMKSYPYKIELISRSELNQKILQSSESFYYINYVQSSADKIFSIINGNTGEVIYSEATRNSYRLKEKDIEKLAKSLK